MPEEAKVGMWGLSVRHQELWTFEGFGFRVFSYSAMEGGSGLGYHRPPRKNSSSSCSDIC